MDAEPVWGVTALQAIEEMDAGPIWASRSFAVDTDPPRKSALYNGSVADAAVALIHEVVAGLTDPGFTPEPLDDTRPGFRGRLRPAVRQSDRGFSWSDPTEWVLRRIRAADGAPGVHTRLCDLPVTVFDAHRGGSTRASGPCPAPSWGAAMAPCSSAPVTAASGSVSCVPAPTRTGSATSCPQRPCSPTTSPTSPRPTIPRATGRSAIAATARSGLLDFRFYNGAMSSGSAAGWLLRCAMPRSRTRGCCCCAAGSRSATVCIWVSSMPRRTRPRRPGATSTPSTTSANRSSPASISWWCARWQAMPGRAGSCSRWAPIRSWSAPRRCSTRTTAR